MIDEIDASAWLGLSGGYPRVGKVKLELYFADAFHGPVSPALILNTTTGN